MKREAARYRVFATMRDRHVVSLNRNFISYLAPLNIFV